jgi:hypothetical protein
MNVPSSENTIIRSYRADGIATQAMRIAGIDYDSYQPDESGVERWHTPSETLRRMGKVVASCTEIGNVGHALLRAAEIEV